QLLARSVQAADEFRRTFKLKDDPRITRLGRTLRQTSLDELPQFWNVLRGEMSVVGPRPVVEEELARYGRYSDDYLSVRPGVTGSWQVMGRNDTTYLQRVLLDAHYVRAGTLVTDFKIVARTVVVMLRRTRAGAY
ncbi:MAG: sugar transferase, partial [Actinomycetota bacterium]|nr:sugar transferase [Actinomycetota bacterium]